MRYHEIVNEALDAPAPSIDSRFPGLDRAAIIEKMVSSICSKRYWDDAAIAHAPEMADDGDTYKEIAQAYAAKGKSASQAAIAGWAEARFGEVADKLAAIPLDGGRYRLHRIIAVAPNWGRTIKAKGGSSLGLYWTYDFVGWNQEIGAYAIWNKDESRSKDVLIGALAAPTSVDWTGTFLSNMDWYSGDREFEIRLKRGAPIEVVSIIDYNYRRKVIREFTGLAFTA